MDEGDDDTLAARTVHAGTIVYEGGSLTWSGDTYVIVHKYSIFEDSEESHYNFRHRWYLEMNNRKRKLSRRFPGMCSAQDIAAMDARLSEEFTKQRDGINFHLMPSCQRASMLEIMHRADMAGMDWVLSRLQLRDVYRMGGFDGNETVFIGRTHRWYYSMQYWSS